MPAGDISVGYYLYKSMKLFKGLITHYSLLSVQYYLVVTSSATGKLAITGYLFVLLQDISQALLYYWYDL